MALAPYPFPKVAPRPAAHLPPVEEPPPDHGPTPDPSPVEQPPPIEDNSNDRHAVVPAPVRHLLREASEIRGDGRRAGKIIRRASQRDP